VDLSLPNHLGQADANLSGAHRASHAQNHRTTALDMRSVAVSGVHESRRIKVLEVSANESSDRSVVLPIRRCRRRR